jgi:hypothetical protein
MVIGCTRSRSLIVASEDREEARLEFGVLCPRVVVDVGEKSVLVSGMVAPAG